MAQFSKEELSFVKELPEQVEIECPVCLNILTNPHLVTCCGRNFCGPCIERVKASDGSCPVCNKKEYIVAVNKERLRIINGLEVYCINKEKGCQWKGEFSHLSTHLNKEKREGECQYEEVKCSRYERCQERKQRKYLKDHEDRECPQRPFQCQYCEKEGTFISITKDHYVKNECPLEPVDCVFSWAGCNDKPVRKDVDVHTADTKHMTLLAVACGQLKKENEKMKEENEQIKREIRNIRHAIADYPLIPIKIERKSEPAHFYTGKCGVHMSAKMKGGNKTFTSEDVFLLLAFHEGKYEEYKPKIPKIIADDGVSKIPIIKDTKAPYKHLPRDILMSIKNCNDDTDLEEGVIKIKLGKYERNIPGCIRLERVTIKNLFE